jgi:PST family polysaccharide transporter
MNITQTSIRKASLINIIARYSSIFIQILYNAVLARILTPKDFGIVAVLTVFSSFFSLLANMGIGTAVIQNKELSENDNNSLFTFTLYLGIFFMFFFVALSFPIALFYDNSVYKSLGAILSISLCFNILNTVPNAILLKQKRFLVVGIRTVVVTIISSAFTIFLAVIGLRYYSIVFHSVILSILLFTWNMFSIKLHVKSRVDWSSIKKIRNYASYQFLFNITNYFARNLDNLLIGKYLGDVPLGYYNKSYTLMLFPIQNLTHVITPVLHPILSDYQNDKEKIFTQYMKVVKLLSLLGVFVTPFCFYAADELILLFFGDQWTQAIPVFRFLSISIYAQMITSSTGVIFQSLGNTKLLFKTGLITTFISIVAIVFGISTGDINRIAICVTVAYNLHFLVSFIVLIKSGFQLSYKKFVQELWMDWIIMFGLFLVLFFLKPYFSGYEIYSLIQTFIVTLIGYCVGIFITKQTNIVKKFIGLG